MLDSARRLVIRNLGLVDYRRTWRAMQDFVQHRRESSDDEFWVLQHPPVYTLGQAARSEHLLCPGGIEVVQTDRGGQVTYHGPGQLVVYLLLDLRRRNMGPKGLVDAIEASIIALLTEMNIQAHALEGARGVYVGGRKIASIGLRIRQGCSYHGLALNVDMDLAPFAGINPCGIEGMQVTQVRDFCPDLDLDRLELALVRTLALRLEFDELVHLPGNPCGTAAVS